MNTKSSRRIAFVIASIVTILGVGMQWPMHKIMAAPAWSTFYVADVLAKSRPELWRYFGTIIVLATITNVLVWWATLFVILRIASCVPTMFRGDPRKQFSAVL